MESVTLWVRPADLHLVNAGESFRGWIQPTPGHVQLCVDASRIDGVAAGSAQVRARKRVESFGAFGDEVRSKLEREGGPGGSGAVSLRISHECAITKQTEYVLSGQVCPHCGIVSRINRASGGSGGSPLDSVLAMLRKSLECDPVPRDVAMFALEHIEAFFVPRFRSPLGEKDSAELESIAHGLRTRGVTPGPL